MKRLFACMAALTFLFSPLSAHPRGPGKFQAVDTEGDFRWTHTSRKEFPGEGQERAGSFQGMKWHGTRVSPLQVAANTKHYDESLFSMTEEGHFSVELLKKGEGTVDIIIHDSRDVDVEGGVVEAFMWTPGEGVLESEKLEVSEIRGGRYRVRGIAPRDGAWGIFFRIRKEGTVRADDLVDSVKIELSGTGS